MTKPEINVEFTEKIDRIIKLVIKKCDSKIASISDNPNGLTPSSIMEMGICIHISNMHKKPKCKKAIYEDLVYNGLIKCDEEYSIAEMLFNVALQRMRGSEIPTN